MNEEYAQKIIAYVEAYYSQHKLDQPKPINWDLILLIKYMAHKCREMDRIKNALEENTKILSELEKEIKKYKSIAFESWGLD